MAVEVEKSVRQFVDGLNAMDVDAMLSIFAPDATVSYPGLGTSNVEAFRQFLGQAFEGVSSTHLEENEIFVTEFGAGSRWTFDATAKTGRSAHVEGIDSWVFGADGKVKAFAVFADVTPLVEALAS
jgi:ketosteroid isomerase-like protein